MGAKSGLVGRPGWEPLMAQRQDQFESIGRHARDETRSIRSRADKHKVHLRPPQRAPVL